MIGLHFVPVTESLSDGILAKQPMGQGAGGQLHILSPKPHGAPKPLDGLLLRKFGNDWGAVFRKFQTVGVFETGSMPGKFNDGHLEPKANAQKWDPALTGKSNGLYLGLHPAIAKAAWDDDGIQIKFRKNRANGVRLVLRNIHPFQFRSNRKMGRGVLDTLFDRGIGISQACIFAQYANAYRLLPRGNNGLRVAGPRSTSGIFRSNINPAVQIKNRKKQK